MKIFSAHEKVTRMANLIRQYKKTLVLSSDVLVSSGLILTVLYSTGVLHGAPLLIVAIVCFVIGISLMKITGRDISS